MEVFEISIKNYIPKTIKLMLNKGIVKYWKTLKSHIELTKFAKKSLRSKIFLIGTPIHGNLGDQAIAHAEIKFLKDNLEDYDIFEIQFLDLRNYLKSLKVIIKPKDVIMLHGGGNMGVEYLHEEELRRTIINNFKEQKIISFPQTIYFGETEIGKQELERTKKIYNSHPNLTIIARETVSFNIMKDLFINNKVILTPDIVMYLNEGNPVEQRKKILFCFRNDVESIVDSNFKENLYNRLSIKDYVVITDTVVNYTIERVNREKELGIIWKEFRQSKLIITDRLHGMVFAAITSTPCIALSNYNQKVKGTYDWIKHLPYIRFLEDPNEINKHIEELLKLDQYEYNNNFTKGNYEEIIKIIYMK